MHLMWAKLGRRLLDFSIGFFALLGFVLVPLGERTAFEHVKAIFSTGPAVEAGRDLLEAGAAPASPAFSYSVISIGCHCHPSPCLTT